jgi:probable F420-dependent oxidoreductase
VRFGLLLPVVSRNPRFDPPAWDAEAGIQELATIARRADRLGYRWLSFPEHVAVPEDAAARRGGTYWAPLPVMGYLAAVTSRVRLTTCVIVLGYHHPLEVVKSYGTLDRVSGGRLILGVGVGSLIEEFDLLGADFGDRGARADDALLAIRASWGRSRPRYEGPFYRFDGWVMDPAAASADLTVWVGGRTRRSLRRAVSLGEGWMPFGLPPDRLRAMLASVDPADIAALDIVLHPEPPLDPLGDPDGARAKVDEYAAIGATMCNLRFRHESSSHYLEQLEAMVAAMPEAFDESEATEG